MISYVLIAAMTIVLLHNPIEYYMNYFKKIIKKWKLIKSLELDIKWTRILLDNCSAYSTDNYANIQAIAAFRHKCRNTIKSDKKALNKLHKL